MIETLPIGSSRPRMVFRPRLGFAGLGWIGCHRLEVIARSGLAEVAAVYDPAPDAAVKARRLAPDSTAVAAFDDLLASDLDGIVIATPSALHAAQALAALRAGKAVFCQKPLGRNAAETEAVIAAARAADRLLGVDLSYRCTAGMQRIRDLIRRGALGPIYAIETVFHNAYGPNKAWFYDATLSGGGCLLDLGIHLVDLALWCLDFPVVTVVGANLLRGGARVVNHSAVEDYAAAQLLLNANVSLQLACSWRAPAGCDARIELTFFGREGGACFRNVGGSFYDFTAEHFLPDRSRVSLATPPDDWPGRAALVWCQALGASPGFDAGIGHLTAVARALDGIYALAP